MIGIWYANKAFAIQEYNALINQIPNNKIKKAFRSNLCIEFIDGSYLRFVPARDCSRGYKFSESYILIDIKNIIDETFINDVIRFCILPGSELKYIYSTTEIEL